MVDNPILKRASERKTGHHGRKAEDSLANRVKGQTQIGSGNKDGAKGDVKKDTSSFSFLIENKATSTATMSLKQDWLRKINQEALETNKVPALAFQFTNEAGKSERKDRWIAIPEWLWAEIMNADDYSDKE